MMTMIMMTIYDDDDNNDDDDDNDDDNDDDDDDNDDDDNYDNDYADDNAADDMTWCVHHWCSHYISCVLQAVVVVVSTVGHGASGRLKLGAGLHHDITHTSVHPIVIVQLYLILCLDIIIGHTNFIRSIFYYYHIFSLMAFPFGILYMAQCRVLYTIILSIVGHPQYLF